MLQKAADEALRWSAVFTKIFWNNPELCLCFYVSYITVVQTKMFLSKDFQTQKYGYKKSATEQSIAPLIRKMKKAQFCSVFTHQRLSMAV